RLDVAEDLADAELAAGRPSAALDTVELLTREHPFRERLRGLQMLSLYRLGRQAEALATYRDLRRALADELGLEPTASVQALERQILQQDPKLDRPAASPTATRPERVWPLSHPDLPDPAMAAPAPIRREEALTSFVGRDRELTQLSALLAGTRLLTISGVGGAGKTRLALELADRMAKHYADGTRIVELATVRDERPLADDVLSALGAGGSGRSGGPAAQDQLCQVLGDRQLLLVIDNCEHVLEAARALVDTVLRRCPAVTILATSREVLSVPGETTWAAPGLSLPPAVRNTVENLMSSDAAALFVVRARTAQPGFGPSPGNAGAIGRICHRLDGIPLALELAASRVRVLGVTQIADRLEDHLRLLTSGPRSAPARHQTLRATMDWSFDLLTETEQRLLRRLSVFPQHFDLEAATAVAGDDTDPIDVLDLLARLIDKSLVACEGMAEAARYRLLETVRQYAAEKLGAAGETDALGGRHRRHFVERIQAADPGGLKFLDPASAQYAAIDGENYNAALASGVLAGDFESATVILAGRVSWFWGTPVPTAVDSIDPKALTSPNPSLHVAGLLSLGMAGIQSGRWTVETGIPIFERALAIAEKTGTPADEGFACFFLGYVALGRGERRAARTGLERAVRCFADRPLGLYYAQHELGWIELAEGNVAAARRQFESILTVLAGRPGSENPVAHARAAVALCDAANGNVARALTLARAALDESRQIPLAHVEVMALIRMSEVAALSGVPIGAELVEALHLLRRQGGLRWVAAALTMAAMAHEAAGRPEDAARLLGGAACVARMLAEDPLPIAPLGTVVTAMRHRIEAAIGAAACAAAATAGGQLPAPALLDLALDGLAS
ncbi:MAG: ATP-binding protein, partial [Sporichthyaceae bacterium]